MRAIIIVIDGFGIGHMPDARLYNDYGANTLANILNNYDMQLPVMDSLGLFCIDGVSGDNKTAGAAYGRMAELSGAKDTTVGHWEIAGVVTKNPFPTFPKGFPKDFVSKLEKAIGRKILLNLPFSGTEAIKQFGKQHIETGCPIVYTSADSVLQIATHTDVVPLQTLYDWCQIARNLCVGEFNVGRVIARPFCGEYPYTRTQDRKDYSVSPPTKTLLDNFCDAGLESVGIGKIEDIFNFTGLTRSFHTHDNQQSFEKLYEVLKEDFDGLVFVNLIDTDMNYGHRRDVFGYGQCLERIDCCLGHLQKCLKQDDVVYLTSDHGNDPCCTAHTDHTREYVPLMIFGKKILPTNLETLVGFDTVADTIREQFDMLPAVKSVWEKISI